MQDNTLSESSEPSLLTDLKSIAGKSAVYGIGNVALKVIGFLLIPLYTRHLTTEDYGIMGVTSTILAILGIILPLSLHGALMKFFFTTEDTEERKIITGNVWISTIVVASIWTLLLNCFGETLFSSIFRNVPYSPYIRLTIWTAYFTVFSLIPKTLLQAQERPTIYITLVSATTILSICTVIYLVVFRQMGVYGYLLGMMIGSVAMVIPFIIFISKNIILQIKKDIIKRIFLYSLPLVPHGLAAWILELSDRVILERYVPLSDLGLYNLGYQFGTALLLVGNAVNLALAPFLFKTIGKSGDKANSRVTPIVTYYFLLLTVGALIIEIFIKEVVQIMAAPEFHSVYRVTYWIIAAQLLSAYYYIPANLLFVKGKTQYIPIVTITSGIINIGLNLWLVPIYGYMASAWATLISYAVMLFLVWYFSKKIYHLNYEYKRIGTAVFAAACLFAISLLIPDINLVINIFIKILLFISYPLILKLFGFFNQKEINKAVEFLQIIKNKYGK